MARKATIPKDMMAMVVTLLGSAEWAKRWFDESQDFFVCVRPAKLLKTPQGRRFVRAHLKSLRAAQDGVFS